MIQKMEGRGRKRKDGINKVHEFRKRSQNVAVKKEGIKFCVKNHIKVSALIRSRGGYSQLFIILYNSRRFFNNFFMYNQ